jgi:hypothetical protein
MDITVMTFINKSLFEKSNPKRQKDNGKGHFSAIGRCVFGYGMMRNA